MSVRVGAAVRSWSRRQFSSSSAAEEDGKWLTLPPVNISSSSSALKWVIRCCPQLPKTLIHKLFRLKQVRIQQDDNKFKRVTPKDTLNSGDRIFLPHSVKQQQQVPCSNSKNVTLTSKQINFIRSLVIYKDPHILVLNKPPGMPVQGGINIKLSLDSVAAHSLNYDYSQPPLLVHRLDRDCSGILVMGRTKISTALLHSIFRERTSSASNQNDTEKRILQRRYFALVLGFPRRSGGLVNAPLGKVVVDNGKSDRITIVDNSALMSSQHAVTEYRVISSSSHGYTWLELSPLTGRKHQLRVHCAEVLGTPIVGDYKYGRQAHKKWGQFDLSNLEDSTEEHLKEEALPFGLNLNKGSISDKHPRLHLHCKQIILPNISQALQNVQSVSDSSYDLSVVESLELEADLPPYMKKSWEVTNS